MNKKAFSLVELLIVVSVIAVMAVGATVGFGKLADLIGAQETSNVIADTVRQVGLEVLRGESARAAIHFDSDFLAVELSPDEGASQLGADFSAPACDVKLFKLASAAALRKTNEKGDSLGVSTLEAADLCVKDFKDSADRVWNFELTQGGQTRGAVRLMHFNLNREQSAGLKLSSAPTDLTLVIEGPYGKKTFYSNGVPLTVNEVASVTLTGGAEVTPQTVELKSPQS